MLISKTAKLRWHPSNKKKYVELGYTFTKMYDEFEVKVEHLSKNSHAIVEWECDGCHDVITGTYQTYMTYVKDDGSIYCTKCKKDGKFKSFEDLCIELNRQDLLERWDTEKNGCKPSEVSYSSGILRWFKCDKHPDTHHSELKKLYRLANGREGDFKCKQCNSLGQGIIDMYDEEYLWKVWNKELNNYLNPFKISLNSNDEYWFNCPDGKHEPYLRSCDSSKVCGYRCPKCSNISLGEIKTEEVLIKYNINYVLQYSFNNCRGIKPLPFDFYLPDYNICIEFDGIQHFEPRDFTSKNNDYDKALDSFIGCKVRDTIKNIYCEQNNIKLIRIPYWHLNDIETILINELNINIQKLNIS